LEAFRGDWEDFIYMEQWRDNFAALEEIYQGERDHGRSPTDIVLLYFTSFVNRYRTDLARIVRAAFRHAPESAKVAYNKITGSDVGQFIIASNGVVVIRRASADVESNDISN
jgi:hypothetical protein